MKKMQTKHLVLLALNTTIWTINSLAINGTLQLSAKTKSGIELITEPSRVRLTLNGVPFKNGAYVTTPILVPLPAGSHKIMIQRSGYHSNTSTVITNASDEIPKITTVLEASNESLKTVIIDSSDPAAMSHLDLSISGGLEVGKIPLQITDLVAGIHILEITSGLWSKPMVRCQFEVPVQKANTDPINIKVEPEGKKIRIHGCKKI